MKKPLTLTILCALAGLAGLAYAGSENYSSNKEVMQQAPASCDWYRAHEWDLSLWGTYAFSGNTGHADPFSDRFAREPEDAFEFDQGQWGNDRFLNRDGAWGGGADVKFFFSKYWALGAEGFVVDANDNIGGAGLGTFTFRFPIGCSRFAPYAYAGGGVLGGGTHSDRFFFDIHTASEDTEGEEEENEFRANRSILNKHYEAIGQFGAGLEIRVTRHIGIMGDFAWNVVSGPDNNFGLARFGVTLSY
jgi:hypothetical protein